MHSFDFVEAGDLPALPTRAELEIQKSRQVLAQVSTEPTIDQPDQSTKMESIEADTIVDDDVVDIHFDCE